MQFILATDYAIRALVYLTRVDRKASASEISEKMMIPRQYLVTMSRKMRDADIMGSCGGQQGGYYLTRPASDISLLDIMKVTELTMCINPCLEPDKPCQCCDEEKCATHKAYVELQGIMDDYLANVTLRDLAREAV